jgi:tripartite-type tricarboxylate transporter receptor subunit TctC
MRRSIGTILLLGVALSTPAWAQTKPTTFPQRPVRLIVPSAPGGGTDLIARLLYQRVSETWGQPVIVVNQPGGGTIIGTHNVAKATPDGHTLLMTAANFSMIPALNPKLPYDPEKDFAPVMAVASQTAMLAVNATLPVKTVSDLVNLVKSKPGEFRYGSGGSGTPNHFSSAMFGMITKVQLTHIPYNGTGPSVTALLSNEIHMLITNSATILPHVKSGRMRGLAVTGLTRAKAAPDIPTLAEAGVPNYRYESWYGLWAPASTPRALVAMINDAFNKALLAPQTVERFAEPGIEAMGGPPEKFAAFVSSELKKWKEVAKAADISPD